MDKKVFAKPRCRNTRAMNNPGKKITSWDLQSVCGENALATYGEVAVTMAVAAARDCLVRFDPYWIGHL